MKKKYLASLFFGLLLLNTACEDVDKNEIYQEKFHKILYLKTTGVVDVTLYRTGEDAEYNLSVLKGGSEPTLTADANLSTMTKAELDEYCAARGIFLKGLPTDLYKLAQTDVHFESSDLYHIVGVSLQTEEISQLIKAEAETEFVIPLILRSATDSVNSTKNIIIMKPKIVTPKVGFEKIGYVENYSPKEGKTFEIPITLQIPNQWNFDCEVEVDPTALEGTPYSLLPEGSYSLENGGRVSFKKGIDAAILKVTVKGLTEIEQVLPLRIKSISNTVFDKNLNPILFGITLNKYPLTEKMLSTNAQEPEEGPLKDILDGDVTTYFHSKWSGDAMAEKHYVQVNLPAKVSSFKFSYTNRSANGDASLADFDVSVSSDGTNFTLLKNFTTSGDKLPTGASGVFNSTLMKSPTPISSIRFTCNKNKNGKVYFVWSEFSLSAL